VTIVAQLACPRFVGGEHGATSQSGVRMPKMISSAENRRKAAPERDGRGSSIALTNTASNNAPNQPAQEPELITRRRRWSPTQKAALLEEVEDEGGKVAVVARRHGISESLLYNWRSAWDGGGI
jgi:transposase